MTDDKIRELYIQQHIINVKIIEEKIKIAKENGQVVGSIDDIICDKHPNAIFRVVGTINDSWMYKMKKENGDGLNIYQCEPCGEDENIFEFDKSKAYDCPICGIVLGEFKRYHYRSSKESWMALAGREGEHYHCSVCDTQIGSHYWKLN